MKPLHPLLSLFAAATLVSCAGMKSGDGVPTGTPVPAQGGKRSSSVSRDLRVMWSVQPKEDGRNWVTATDEAIDAGERVFNTLDLRGQSKDEIAKSLRFDLRADNYGYYAPFWPVDKGVFPIRIDNGNFGWQYDVHFDSEGRVEEVLRRWIH